MANPETFLQRSIQLDLSGTRTRVFRNNVGGAWQGSDFTVKNRRLVSGRAHFVKYGLAEGSADLVLVHSIIVQPWMAGRRLAVFGAAEVKCPNRDADPQQQIFLSVIRSLGGIADVVHSVDEARSLINQLDTR